MMHAFLSNNHDELLARCRAKVAARPRRDATPAQLANGIPMFLDQLTRTLLAEGTDEEGASLRISGPSGGDGQALSEIGHSATAHGAELLGLGFTVDQVVHDYGDLCQAITDLAFERDAPFTVDEFRTLNRCLDNAIADAVLEFSLQRDAHLLQRQNIDANERMGFLVHELRNALGTATLAVHVLEFGSMPLGGATGAVLKRSLASLKDLIDRAVSEVRTIGALEPQVFALDVFIAEAESAAQMEAAVAGCRLLVPAVDPLLALSGNRALLQAALGNLLQNAFKFTRKHTEIRLDARLLGAHVLIEVTDCCGGLAPGSIERMFRPFAQRSENRNGLGLGLSIARQTIEADSGTLSVRDLPGVGCVFTISLPAHTVQ